MIRALALWIACLGCNAALASERAPVVDACGSKVWECGDPYVPDLVNGLRDLGAVAIYAQYGGGIGDGRPVYTIALVRGGSSQWQLWFIPYMSRGGYQTRRLEDASTTGTPREYVSGLERLSRPIPARVGRALRALWASALERMHGGYAGSPGLDGMDITFATDTHSVSAWETPNELLAEMADLAQSLVAVVRAKTDAAADKWLHRVQRNLDRIEFNLKSNTY